MGLTCLHKRMTVSVMKRLGFSDRAAQIAGDANARVDDKQGNSARETNLHAMCGLGQRDADCRTAIAKIIHDGQQDVVDGIASVAGKIPADPQPTPIAAGPSSDIQAVQSAFLKAYERIGETLHTVQDLCFHKYEPWPFHGVGEAFLQDPNYMICHAIRDLGVVSVTNALDVDVNWRISEELYVGVKGFVHPANNYLAPSPWGRPPEFAGSGGMLTITFGAAPGSVQPKDYFPDSRGARETKYSSMMSSGRADLSRAEDDTEKFIDAIRRDVEAQPDGTVSWNWFLQIPI